MLFVLATCNKTNNQIRKPAKKNVLSVLLIAGLGSILILLPLAIGIVLGIFSAAKLIAYLFKKFPTATYAGIIGFVIGSIFALVYEGGIIEEFFVVFSYSSFQEYLVSPASMLNGRIFYTWAILLIGFLLFFAGLFGSLILTQLSDVKEKEKLETEELINAKREKMKQELIEELTNNAKSSGDTNDQRWWIRICQ